MSTGDAVLAIDLGAEGGRAVAVRLRDGRLVATEVARFPVRSEILGDAILWDVPGLYGDVDRAVDAAAAQGPLTSVGIDGWAIDFGLLDSAGDLVGPPHHYRDPRNAAGMADVLATVDAARLYARTGIQILRINTLFQLRGLALRSPAELDAADRLLMIPDLLHAWLGGGPVNEVTNASTTQLLAADGSGWAHDLMAEVGLPGRLFHGTPVEPGTVLGPLARRDRRPTGAAMARVVAPATHDTASAVIGVPGLDDQTAFISSGTWSLVGVELPGPILTEAAFRANLSNERGYGGTIRLLRNVMGLWLLAECRRGWTGGGNAPPWERLIHEAERASRFALLFDPDHPSLMEPGDLPARILAVAADAEHDGSPGAMTRAILECLALKYRYVLEQLVLVTGRAIARVAVVGGGSRNELLCQLTANATGRPVDAGPAEATSLGNAGVQLVAAGELAGVAEIREVIGRTHPPTRYEPRDQAQWDDAYARFCRILDVGVGSSGRSAATSA